VVEVTGAPGALLIAPDAQWIRPPGCPWQDLGARSAVRRILSALIERRREAPGCGLSLVELRDAGWPGERILPDAAMNRVYVALTQLRKLGFRTWLKRSDEGYYLDPALQIDQIFAEPPAR
jgi:hypothetical protein